MAIGSVYELVDYKQETIKLAKKYGGGGGDASSIIADAYNPDRTTGYTVDDLVIYNGKLYKSTRPITVSAGTFDSTMWDKIADYDPTQTYNDYDRVIYEGVPYRCDESNVTGEWDASKWTDISIEFPDYDPNSKSYYANGARVKYDGDYYVSNATYTNQGTVGEWDGSKWTETTVEDMIKSVKLTSYVIGLGGKTTDENGLLAISSLGLPQGATPYTWEALPYGGQAPAGTWGFCVTRINKDYILIESLTAGVREPLTSTELGSQYAIKVNCISM